MPQPLPDDARTLYGVDDRGPVSRGAGLLLSEHDVAMRLMLESMMANRDPISEPSATPV